MPKATSNRKRAVVPATSLPGRPSLILDDALVGRFLTALRTGNWVATACAWAGISDSTYRTWMDRGRQARRRKDEGEGLPEGEAIYLRFLGEVEQAEAEAEARAVANLMRQTADSPAAALGFLSVRFPQRWRQKSQVEISGPDGGPIPLSPILSALGDDELEARIRRLEQEIQGADHPGVKVIEGGKVS
jgi:hypothetical protein